MSNGTSYSTAEPFVSVVIPTYNRARLLGRAIRSVLAQSYCDFEVIVVDDGSTDETAGVVESFGDRRVRYVALARNGGAGAARNAGIRLARGKFLAFQDSDDEWLPSKLAKQMSAFERGPSGLGVVYSDMRRVWDDGRETYLAAPDVLSGRLVGGPVRFYQVCDLGVQSAVIRRECLDAAGHFNEELPALEDLEMFIRLSRLCAFERLREPLVRYHDTQGLSKDRYAKWVSRKVILRLYYKELLTRNPAFLFKEALWLCATRGLAVWARRAGRR
ncbi:MAG: glycosyltransferase [Acidobacteria bacterium]|nr:glycosyltransferase [Acidobacteriota bacterium]